MKLREPLRAGEIFATRGHGARVGWQQYVKRWSRKGRSTSRSALDVDRSRFPTTSTTTPASAASASTDASMPASTAVPAPSTSILSGAWSPVPRGLRENRASPPAPAPVPENRGCGSRPSWSCRWRDSARRTMAVHHRDPRPLQRPGGCWRDRSLRWLPVALRSRRGPVRSLRRRRAGRLVCCRRAQAPDIDIYVDKASPGRSRRRINATRSGSHVPTDRRALDKIRQLGSKMDAVFSGVIDDQRPPPGAAYEQSK